ncbi:MAG: acyl-CoA dehydrogenase family protein [Acidimicrobiales bacterium]|nr:acyl-CoA dehydrogenase family protein [Acidimicrobiales bacterium]
MTAVVAAPTGRYPADPVAATAALEPLIAAHRPEMDAQRRLPQPVVDAMVDIGILRAAVPVEYGGPAYDPRTQVRLVEEFSRLDGSVGWCAMIASASSFVVGFLGEERARHWFGPANASLAGQLAPTGRAQRVEGGHRVSGRFRFGSGSGHATMFLAGCLVHDDAGAVKAVNGRPRQLSVLIRPDQCTVVDTWHTTGLWGTGSNDYVIDDVFVPDEDSYDPLGSPVRTEPLYRYPPLFLLPHTGVPLGIARAAIDAVLELAGDKELYPGARAAGSDRTMRDDPGAQYNVAVAEAKLAAARAFAYDMVDQLWEPLQAGERIPTRTRAMYRIMMTYLHQVGKEVVELMYDTASASAIYRDNPLDRLMRDMLTGAQHRMVHPKIYRPAGRLLLGLDSGDPLV